jgi:hypothetical protein
MTNEEKAARLKEIAQHYLIGDDDAALLREAAQLIRKRETLLTGPDWKTMHEALKQIIANRVGDVGMCGSRHCDCSECVATAALARLEGK